MSLPPPTLTVTFLYSHTRGVYEGMLPNGTRFSFIAPPDSNIPTKLINALSLLQRETVGGYEKETGRKPETVKPDLTELDQKIAAFEARHGVTRGPSRKKAKPVPVNLTLEDLGL